MALPLSQTTELDERVIPTSGEELDSRKGAKTQRPDKDSGNLYNCSPVFRMNDDDLPPADNPFFYGWLDVLEINGEALIRKAGAESGE